MGGTLLFAVGGQSMKIIVSVLSKQTRSPQNALFFFFFLSQWSMDITASNEPSCAFSNQVLKLT